MRDIERARYCQQYRESVNMKTFDQSEHDTRISYHGTAASKACLLAPPHFPSPQDTARLASLADIFPILPRFLPISTTVEPDPRLTSLRSRRLEVVDARTNRRARGRHSRGEETPARKALRACLHGSGGPQVGEVTLLCM